MKLIPKVGDRVRLVKPHDEEERAWVGQVGTVVEVDLNNIHRGCRYRFKPDEDDFGEQWIGEDAVFGPAPLPEVVVGEGREVSPEERIAWPPGSVGMRGITVHQIEHAIAFLRENWRGNDGAEGESVRLVCDVVENLMKRPLATLEGKLLVWVEPESLFKLYADNQSLANQVTTLQARMSEMVVERQAQGIELRKAQRRIKELEDNEAARVDGIVTMNEIAKDWEQSQ